MPTALCNVVSHRDLMTEIAVIAYSASGIINTALYYFVKIRVYDVQDETIVVEATTSQVVSSRMMTGIGSLVFEKRNQSLDEVAVLDRALRLSS